MVNLHVCGLRVDAKGVFVSAHCMHAQDTAWCYGGSAWLLPGDFLIVWGARWGPLMRAQPYRWFTSWFLHQSFVHVLSNMLLFLAVALQARACSLAAAISPL